MRSRHSTLTAIVLGGAVAGTIDIGAACLINMLSPIVILHAVASGALGRTAAMAGGLQSAAIGAALQIAMSLLIAAIYVLASNALPVLKRHWLPAGLAFGVGVFFVMEYVVVPLSAVGHVPHFTAQSFALNMMAMLLFGAIVAYYARAK
ncbi:MAG TPA: hypothetical protein VII56_19115 [Rhizomicrobium sp.]